MTSSRRRSGCAGQRRPPGAAVVADAELVGVEQLVNSAHNGLAVVARVPDQRQCARSGRQHALQTQQLTSWQTVVGLHGGHVPRSRPPAGSALRRRRARWRPAGALPAPPASPAPALRLLTASPSPAARPSCPVARSHVGRMRPSSSAPIEQQAQRRGVVEADRFRTRAATFTTPSLVGWRASMPTIISEPPADTIDHRWRVASGRMRRSPKKPATGCAVVDSNPTLVPTSPEGAIFAAQAGQAESSAPQRRSRRAGHLDQVACCRRRCPGGRPAPIGGELDRDQVVVGAVSSAASAPWTRQVALRVDVCRLPGGRFPRSAQRPQTTHRCRPTRRRDAQGAAACTR